MINMTNCETCVNYVYDEDYEYYICLVDLDEDETHRLIHDSTRDCPYFVLMMNTALKSIRCKKEQPHFLYWKCG